LVVVLAVRLTVVRIYETNSNKRKELEAALAVPYSKNVSQRRV